MLTRLLNLSRTKKRLISVAVDSVFLLSSFVLAHIARFDSVEQLNTLNAWLIFFTLLPISIFSFVKLGLYRAVLRYMNFQALWAVLTGVVISVIAFIALSFLMQIPTPRAVPFIYGSFALIMIGGARVIVRALIGRHDWRKKDLVLIYGAGSAGRQLATALSNGPEYYVSAFIDDDKSKQSQIIQGLKVYDPRDVNDLVSRYGIKNILLALPSTSRSRRKEILSTLENATAKVLTIPGMTELVKGNATPEEIKDVEVEDLLGRDPVTPKQELMSANIKDKVVMVTGAGGSIGAEMCRQIIKQKPAKLILFEISEFSLYAIDKELRENNELQIEIIPLIGTIQAQRKLISIMETFGVQTIYHAAAYKHVPLVEHNVIEAVKNNIFGTLNTAKAAIKANVETLVLISTDKAVRPTNVMGTTKRMAELVLQALAKEQSTTRFCMVRFGNVLGSSGSVVPLFRKQIRKGGPITLTHMDITRYFMTIPEASQLVIQAGAMGQGGDVFVLDMGESVKIYDLASKMVRLSGLELKNEENPNGDIEIKCTGLRPGEKLYEELLIGDNVYGTNHERILTAKEVMLDWQELEKVLTDLNAACEQADQQSIRDILLQAPTDFSPTDGICDLIWQEKQLNKESNESNLTVVKS